MVVLGDPTTLLFIEPSDRPSTEPLIDDLTRRMQAAWNARVSPNSGFRGVHTCRCGEQSDNKNHTVHAADGTALVTNSLCVHYLMYHRDEVPESELEKVRQLPEV